ncbi:glycoside hydrolase family 3 C-terminal domain-containing protein [Streptomyces boninensis]|uniref:glycoside hydrolase family 3 C-terminal domain-containing protein n=1 Tax=Streptomyces boninensis TaxID=2039455 RepID=UPI003B226ABE
MKRRTVLTVPLVAALVGAVGVRPASAAAAPAAASAAPGVEELLGKLTLDEKISLLHQWQPAIPRLGVRSFRTGTEALHGLAWLGKATVFPQAIGLASTWNPALIEQVGSAVGDEVRGLQHERPKGWGLNVWSPTVQLLRDPRWGRNEEGYSEDPHLTGVMSTAYAKGLSGGDPDHLKTAPLVKHYLANNNEVRRDRTSSDLRPRVLKEYEEPAYNAAISADAACGVMTAYNLVNGRPCTVTDLNASVRTWTDRALLNVTDAWAPNNLPATGSQKYFDTLAEADAAIIKAGLDSFTTDDTDPSKTIAAINEALDKGLLEEPDIDTAVRHILDIRSRLGDFDEDGGPYGHIDKSVIDSPAHRKLARRAATEAIVLLKNDGGALPLDARKLRKVAVVGPLADTLYTDWYSGELPYEVTPRAGIAKRLGAGATVTAREGVDRIALKNAATGAYITAGGAETALKERAGEPGEAQHFDVFGWGQGVVTLRAAANGKVVGMRDPDGSGSEGNQFFNDQDQPNGWFVSQLFKLEAQDDDTVLLKYSGYEDWLGDSVYLHAREDDGTLVLGPAADASRYTREVVRDGIEEAVAAAKGADAAIVVVGSMPFINSRETDDREDMGLAETQAALVKAVLAANPKTVVVVENSYPTTLTWEQEHAPALLWTTHAGQETGNALADVLFGDANPAGRLTQTWYRSADALPSILEYDNIKHDRTYQYFTGDVLYPFGHGLSYTTFRYGKPRAVRDGIEVTVTNTGRRQGAEVVQLYTRQQKSRVKQPRKKLQAFRKVELKPGQSRTVTLPLAREDLAHWDVTRSRWVVERSAYEVMVGSSSGDIRGRTTLDVRGETIPARDLSHATRAENFDDYNGVRLVDESKPRGTAVGAEAGAWLLFADTDLGGGARRLRAQLAKESSGEGTVEVRLGAPDGRLAGRATAASTGSRYTYKEVTASLKGASGRQDVYLILSEGLRLSTFSLR